MRVKERQKVSLGKRERHVCMYIYIYTYIQRERGKRDKLTEKEANKRRDRQRK